MIVRSFECVSLSLFISSMEMLIGHRIATVRAGRGLLLEARPRRMDHGLGSRSRAPGIAVHRQTAVASPRPERRAVDREVSS